MIFYLDIILFYIKIPSFGVDTHVHRLANRWGLSQAKHPNKVQEDLCRIFNKEKWSTLHLQFIYFGREYCTAKDHRPIECPICSLFTASPTPQREFTPKKKSKGILFYEERFKECQVEGSPQSFLGEFLSSSPSPSLSLSSTSEEKYGSNTTLLSTLLSTALVSDSTGDNNNLAESKEPDPHSHLRKRRRRS